MTDRELLELAARAAGYHLAWAHDGSCCFVPGKDDPWSPLYDDGDALRLAVRLSIRTEPKDRSVYAENWEKRIYVREPMKARGREERSLEACMRRAIVRAAAEIGRAMG